VALIDIGAHSTELAIYDGDALLMASSIPIGAEHFTRDISWLLKINYDSAETLKREFGSALGSAAPENSMVELPSGDASSHREASRRELNEILEARAEQLFERVHAEVRRGGMEQSLLEGAVLTGGGALLPGMCDVAERVMHCQARKGLATGIEDWPAEIDDPVWATAAGLAMYSARLKLRRDWKRGAMAGATN
jgi:cell division protein FtsA